MAFIINNIKAGFAASGIYPVNVLKPLCYVIQFNEIAETSKGSD